MKPVFYYLWIPIGLAVVGFASDAQADARAEDPAEEMKLRSSSLLDDFKLDGDLNEASWGSADSIDNLTMVAPNEGASPSGQTIVKVLSNEKYIAIGIDCKDPDPSGIVSYSVGRDAYLGEEDHVKVVIDTFGDGRSGYVFAVNPSGARYDALVAHRGEGENKNWDGEWEAKTTRNADGWSVEILIPVRTLSFRKGLTRWSFNVERKIARLMETSRWSGPKQDYRITQTSHAGAITGLPDFDLGFGLSTRPSLLMGYGSPSIEEEASFEDDFSVDITQKLGPNILASLTINTDFAETEVDEFRTNLTRFELFLPEKRTFFLEGSEIFDFGLGIGSDAMPFHSRRLGLVDGMEVPIWLGGKLHGQVGGTSFGGLVVNMKEIGYLEETNMGVFRAKQNVFEESSVGLIGTFGDPVGRDESWTLGTDFTYQTSKLFGDKNFLVGVWGMAMDRQEFDDRVGSETTMNDRVAFGGKIDYPNDLWDAKFVYKHIGDDFDPSVGFVPRKGINIYHLGIDFMPRPDSNWIRQMFYELNAVFITDLSARWESYDVFLAPLNFKFESGDEFEFNIFAQGENLKEDFEIANDVVIPADAYGWTRYKIEFESATKRRLYGEAGWSFGPFYSGMLNTLELELTWNPIPLLTISFAGERNMAQLEEGSFTEDVYRTMLGLNISPDLTFSSVVQYETEDNALGTNTRIRWTITPSSNLYLIYNHNWAEYYGELTPHQGDWRRGAYETKIKLDYTFHF